MKNLFRLVRLLFGGCTPPKAGLLFVLFWLLTTAIPLHAQWVQTNGPYGGYVYCFAVSGTNLFAGTYGGGVWRRPLSDMITAVESFSTSLPAHFRLDQNYPNPFNPTTTISFSLPSKSFALLKVFDALGKEVSTLLAEELGAGTYARQWNAAGLPSGVYFYRLEAGDFLQTKKLLLLK